MAQKPLEDWKIISSRYSFQDQWVKVRSDKVLLPTGRTLDPYHAVEVPDGVNIIPITHTGNILLVEQHRHVVGRTLLEIPAGHIDPGEEPEAAGRRELLEETGYAGENWHDLGALFSGASRLTSQFEVSLYSMYARLQSRHSLKQKQSAFMSSSHGMSLSAGSSSNRSWTRARWRPFFSCSSTLDPATTRTFRA